MKVIFAFLVIVLLNYGVVAESFDNDKEECVKELQLNREEIIKLDELDLPPDDNSAFNNFVVCDSKKKGLMSVSGEILFDGIERLLTDAPELKSLSKVQLMAYKNIMKHVVNACKTTAMVTDPGVNMIHVHACMYRELSNIKKSLE